MDVLVSNNKCLVNPYEAVPQAAAIGNSYENNDDKIRHDPTYGVPVTSFFERKKTVSWLLIVAGES